MIAKGEKNPRWNGGTSEYPNHYEFKKNRREALRRTKGACARCGEYAEVVHHKDGNKANHSIENLEPLCSKCHWLEHPHARGSQKYKKIYGKTLKELAKEAGISVSYLSGILNKKRSPHPKIAPKISAVTGIPILNLLYPQDEARP